ncbi:hypothetical protein [Flavobacterium sp. UBA7663]|uniref:hypothetical protein n=1 Tax=Flavobacterium sp. UBA7663 TaxID=1946557 RepID=UPI0025B951A7|nr:hypothetical protein [Flavobacterium sp. UBA7663]
MKKTLHLDTLLYNSLSEQLTTSQIIEYFKIKEKWQWLSYPFIPLLLFIKITLIASVLYIGTFFYSKNKVTFKQLFNALVKAEFVFLGVGVLKIVWFYFFQTSYTLEDLQYFFPLSALNIIGYKGLDAWFIYPLQVLNLFELAYWLLLSYFIGKLTFTEKDKGKPMDLGFKIVASSYGSALLLWVVVVMFFTLNYS